MSNALRERLSYKNNMTVAVVVDGPDIKVIGVYDSSEAGRKAATAIEDKLNTELSQSRRTINYLVTEPILVNVTNNIKM
jgi:hypothetical protein